MLELIALPQQRQFGRDKRGTLTRYCRDCDVRFACHGGCPKDRFATSAYGEPGQHYLCPGYKAFFHHITKPMDTMAMLLRGGRAPAELMAIYGRTGLPARSQRPMHLRQRPQVETLPRCSSGLGHSRLRPQMS